MSGLRQIFFDTETTGLHVEQGDRVLDLGCVELIDRRPTGRHFHRFINPERDSHPDALRVHGLGSEFLADKPKFADIATDFLEFIAGAELLAHNADFDVRMINAELARLQLPPLASHASRITDTIALAKRIYPGQQSSLDALCRRLGVDNTRRTLHGALMDAQLLADVYIGMTRGQNSLLADPSGAGAEQNLGQRQDLSGLQLMVQPASADELAAHAAVLADIGKKAPLVWVN
jgi:DNA polymerase-3 subunit epsilon